MKLAETLADLVDQLRRGLLTHTRYTRDVVDHRPDALLALLQLFPHTLALGDVVLDRNVVRDFARRILDR